MPRPEREHQMLEAAGRAFAANGFHDTSMDSIAAAAKISKPMLYNYFGSKRGLYTAYVRRSGELLIQSMRDAAPRDAPAAQRLHAGLLAFLTYVEEHSAGWTLLHRETLAQGGQLAAEVAALRARVTSMLSTFFDDEAFAHAFIGAAESLAGWWLEHRQQPQDQIAAMLMGVAARSTSAAHDHRSPKGR
jgi:AcrR family transcriptional regulator